MNFSNEKKMLRKFHFLKQWRKHKMKNGPESFAEDEFPYYHHRLFKKSLAQRELLLLS